MTNRRNFLFGLGGFALVAATGPVRAAAPTALHVLSTPGCGCCHAWADLARALGYAVTVEDLSDPDAQKAALGVPADLVSCHTVKGDGYVFEGHVPFEAVEAVLRDRPDITGLAVPGMPMGSPGMGDDPTARFDVIAFGGAAGAGAVFYRAGTPRPFAV
ncbi:CopG family transcriptional regulator [Maribius pontilimi]|uniref:CopG family transcriptional regulator n=1 Tax=Palleronia pontilimi TaxID=1964209 RepID=A0A934MGM7_9RHOB|nr:DUF411 domain-containing protein [Palleronia pontilimi]MBJ3762544.1 CopG family transcriptional regulator [Palleronia pontilimi]